MDNYIFLSAVAFLSVILMAITLYKISKKQEFVKYSKTILIIITLIIPILGYFMVINDDKK